MDNEVGWLPWMRFRPPNDRELEFKREGTDQRWTGWVDDLYPEFNVWNVYWRPVDFSGTIPAKPQKA